MTTSDPRMEEIILRAISDLRSNVSEKVQEIVKLAESCPQMASALDYQAILEAIFTPPKMINSEADVKTCLEQKPSNESTDKSEAFMANDFPITESKDTANFDPFSIFESIKPQSKQFTEIDNFDPLFSIDLSLYDNVNSTIQNKSNLDLLTCFANSMNETIMTVEPSSIPLDHQLESAICNDAKSNFSRVNSNDSINLKDLSIKDDGDINAMQSPVNSKPNEFYYMKNIVPVHSAIKVNENYSPKQVPFTEETTIFINGSNTKSDISIENISESIPTSSPKTNLALNKIQDINSFNPSDCINGSDVPRQCSPNDIPRKQFTVPNGDQYFDVEFSEVNNCRNFYLQINSEIKAFSDNFNDMHEGILFDIKNEEFQNSVEFVYKKLYSIYNEEDGRFYRAQLLETAFSEHYWALLIDYGKMKAIPSKYFFQIPKDFINYPILALNCFLDVSWLSDWKYLETGFFEMIRQNLPQSKTIQIRAKFEKEICNRYPVSLIVKSFDQDNWINLLDFEIKLDIPAELNAKFFDFSKFYSADLIYSYENLESMLSLWSLLAMESPHLPLDNEFSVICPYVYTISKFICIIESFENSDTCDRDNFTTNLSLFYQNYCLDSDKSMLNSLVVFRYNDFFFRGFTLMHTGKEHRLLSIDYAFIVTVFSCDIFPLAELFSLDNYPLFTCLCSLDNIMPASKSWSPIAHETFKSWVDYPNKFTIIPKMFLKLTNSMYSIELRLPNTEQTATDLLIKMKYGVPMVE